MNEDSIEKSKIQSFQHECDTLTDGIKFLLNIVTFEKIIFNVKIVVKEEVKVISLVSLKKLLKKFKDNGIIIFIKSSRFLIYWKSKDIQQFLTNKPYGRSFSDADSPLCEYVVEFLAGSLKDGHLGINNNLDISSNNGKIELHSLADSRDYNLLLLASESGNVKPIEILLKYNVQSQLILPDGVVTAQSLAWQGRHFDVLLKLLNANRTFPEDMDVTECSEELKQFIETSLEFHKMIKEQNTDRLDEIHKLRPNLHYFYNLSNDSALKAALDLKLDNIYEFLISKNLSFAPHEDPKEIYDQFTKFEKIKIRSINLKYLKDIPEKHINVLMLNTSLSQDEADEEGKRKLILRAFKALNSYPRLKVILKVVAATKVFHIIFDFDRDSTCRIDPVTSSSTKGIFYFSGRIIIGAKQLLDHETERETFGVLIHELCHYAVLAVYRNHSDPYKAGDQAAKEEYARIVELCKEHMEAEPIIQSVFDDYPAEHQASELIVRPAQLIALYGHVPELLEDISRTFHPLFDYFKRNLVPAMEKALPEIEGRLVYKATTTYDKLSDQDKTKVENAFAVFKDVEVRLNELFVGNPGVFDRLTSDHISQVLKDEVLNLDNPQLRYLEDLVSLKWSSLPKKLRTKFLNSMLNFQGESIKFEVLHQSCPEAFHALTSQQIIKVLSNKVQFSVGIKFEPESDIYVERSFIPEDAKLINFEYEYGHDYVYDSSSSADRKKVRTKDTSFEEFSERLLRLNFKDLAQILQQVKDNASLKLWSPNLNHADFHFLHKNSGSIIEAAENEKLLVLSSEAGAGKTSTFEHLVGDFKARFPNRWVMYVDLSMHVELFSTNKDVQELLIQILKLDPQNNNFEVRIFQECFKAGNLVLVWNGFDEISPTYNEFILNVIKDIHRITSNIQLVSTRPLYSEQLSHDFKVRAWQLVPFDEQQKLDFLRKILKLKSASNDKIEDKIQKIEKVIQKLQFKHLNVYSFNTPLILKLLTEISDQNESETALLESGEGHKSHSIYRIFDSFIERKIEIWLQRNQTALSIAKKLILGGSVKFIFQKFALLNEFRIFASTSLGLKVRRLQIMELELPQALTPEEISSLGILFINGKNEFEFSHKTLAEFFVAQYFIENVYNAGSDINCDEAELRLELFYHLTKVYGDVQQIITDFMASYLQTRPLSVKTFNPTISKLLRTKFRNFFFRMLDINHPKVFAFLFEFFKADHDLLVNLLHVNEDETLYTAAYNPNYFGLFVEPEEIKAFAQSCLTEVELRKFLTGRNQVGRIMFGGHFYGLLGVAKSSEYDVELAKLNLGLKDINSHKQKIKEVNLYDTKVGDQNLLDPESNLHNKEAEASNILVRTQFWQFFPAVRHKLTIGEQKNLFMTALSPKIYLFYKIFSLADFREYLKLWTDFEDLLTPTELQEALGNAMLDYFEIEAGDKIGHEKFLKIFIEKAEKFLTDVQIFEMFLTKRIFNAAHWVPKSFEMLWNFLECHTNQEQRRLILLQDDAGDKHFDFHYSYDERKSLYSNYEYSYYYYDCTSFKVLHKCLTIPNSCNFELTKQIYHSCFSQSEIQVIIASSSDFICCILGRADEQACRNFASYLLELFKGVEGRLKDILDQKIKPTNLTAFELVDDFRGLSHSESHWFNNLDTFVDLRRKLEGL